MLIDEIKKANIQAMKEHDQVKRGAFSIIISRYQAMLTSGNGNEVGDNDIIRIITKFSKELDEEREGYLKAGREENAEAILLQKEAIASFLPKMLDENEIRNIISSLEDKSIPSIMKHFKANYDGKCDMGLVSKIARGL